MFQWLTFVVALKKSSMKFMMKAMARATNFMVKKFLARKLTNFLA